MGLAHTARTPRGEIQQTDRLNVKDKAESEIHQDNLLDPLQAPLAR